MTVARSVSVAEGSAGGCDAFEEDGGRVQMDREKESARERWEGARDRCTDCTLDYVLEGPVICSRPPLLS